jgi:hypothetical protein
LLAAQFFLLPLLLSLDFLLALAFAVLLPPLTFKVAIAILLALA